MAVGVKVTTAPVPATVLLVRAGNVTIPVPWLILVAIAALVTPLCWIVGFAGTGLMDRRIAVMLKNWHSVVLLLALMRGTSVTVRSGSQRGTDVFVRWM